MTPKDVYDRFIQKTQLDFDNAKSKIKECFDKIHKIDKIDRYELEYYIKQCATIETDIFKNKWFFSAPKIIENTPEFYQCAAKTYSMYVELIKYPMELINEHECS